MSGPQGQRGLTLVELLVILTILGILTAIAVPSYGQYRLKVHRSVAKICIADIQRREEAYFLRHDRYSTDLAALALTISSGAYPCGSDPVLYRITLTTPPGKTPACCYQVHASAQGGQTGDGDLTLSYDSSQRNPALRVIQQRRLGAGELGWD